LEQLAKDNAKSGTATSIIAQNLPEILSARALATRQEKYDKREGVTEVDEAVAKNTKDIVSELKSGNNSVNNSVQQTVLAITGQSKQNSQDNKFNFKTLNSLANFASLNQKSGKEQGDIFFGLKRGLEGFYENITFQKGQKTGVKMSARHAIKDRPEEIKKSDEALASMKKSLETLGLVATDNKKYNKLQYEADKADLKFRIKTATSPAKKKELREDLLKLNAEQGSKLAKLGAGIGELVSMGKKTISLGLKAFFTTIGIGALLIALGTFFQSETFAEMTKGVDKLIALFSGKDKEGNPVSLFDRIAGIFSADGLLVLGIAALTVGWVGKKAIDLLLLPLTLGFKVIRGVFRGIGKALEALGLKNKPKVVGALPPLVGGSVPPKAGSVVTSPKGSKVYAGVDGKATTTKVGDLTGRAKIMAAAKANSGGGLGHLKKYPRLLMAAKRIPLLGPILSSAMVASLLLSDASKENKIKGVGGLIGGGLGAAGFGIVGGALGALFTGPGAIVAAPLGALIGAGVGFFGGDWAGQKLAGFLMGEESSPENDIKKLTSAGGSNAGGSPTKPVGPNIGGYGPKGEFGDSQPDLNRFEQERMGRGTDGGASGATTFVDASVKSSVQHQNLGMGGGGPIIPNKFGGLNAAAAIFVGS